MGRMMIRRWMNWGSLWPKSAPTEYSVCQNWTAATFFLGGRAFTQRRKIWAWRPRRTYTPRFDGISLISTINGVVNNSKESHLPVHHWASLRGVMALTHPQCSMVHSAAPKSTRARAFLPQRANNICPKAKRQHPKHIPKMSPGPIFPKIYPKTSPRRRKPPRKISVFFILNMIFTKQSQLLQGCSTPFIQA